MRKRTRSTFNWVYVIIKWFLTNIALETDGRVTIFNGNNVKIGVNMVWSIKGQKATLVEDIKEHKKAITCFSLYEPGNCLLSGSVDKTIKVIKFVNPSQTLIVIREIEIGELFI